MNIYTELVQSKAISQKRIAILLDPEKLELHSMDSLIFKIISSPATHIFIGGSTYEGNGLDKIIHKIHEIIRSSDRLIPIILFPGNLNQISNEAEGILFLQLLSGRNPDYLINFQVEAVPYLEKTSLEIISTGYILIESGNETSVALISKTKPLSINQPDYIAQTAKAGEMIGNKLIYLEAGSGAKNAIPLEIIRKVSNRISIPLIIGGGIRSKKQIDDVFSAGADIVVIGTAFENDINFFD